MSEKPKRKNSDEPKPIGFFWGFKYGFVLAILILIFCYIGVDFARQDIADSVADTYEYEVIGEDARLYLEQYHLPDSATDFYFYNNKNPFLPDYERAIRFQIQADDFEQWLQNSGLCFDDLTADARLLGFKNNLVWWQPHKAEKFISGECGENPIYTILVDQTDNTHWIVYMNVVRW